MCIIGTALKVHKQYPFIMAANRDEFIIRPAAEAHIWQEGFIAGKDLSQGGTWLGLSASGRVAAVTNVRDPEEPGKAELSRGLLVPSWLKEENTAELLHKKQQFGGFNFLYGTPDKLHYETNKQAYSKTMTSGIHTLSNADIETSWPKTECLYNDMEQLMESSKEDLIEGVFRALSRNTPWPEEQLPETGVGEYLEKMLSSAYINLPDYGTRCSTIILVDKDNRATFIERSHRPVKKEVCFQFKLNSESNSIS